ncbi:response regulator [Eubacterium sp. MSJ-13]|uniref:response regulator n=1 Tax=Eubacterium sp. MSJ-13 TaxID=2841513 RepID=UPI001C112506|nr:response regulator [Eubacterium sp. MSJ-13]MBU5478815.1 response regulator [Eubacterium sp. MSJ-13]
MKIIAADDEVIALEELEEAIKEAVKETKYEEAELSCFRNPEKLLEYASEHAYDVVFLDVEMGAISGIDVAKQLKIWNPKVNIVFVTAYSKYMAEAFKMHVSGYIEKPVTAKVVREELDELRIPVLPSKKNILHARCFGTFDVFVNGKSLSFDRSKTKEMLAYLIDRRGNAVTSGELRAVLWEDAESDSSKASYLQKLKKDLNKTLKAQGLEDIFMTSWNKYAIDDQKISCDYYDYLDDKPEGVRAYNGEYMAQYSWGEVRNVILRDREN